MSVGRVSSEPFTIRDRLYRWIDREAAKMRGLSVLRQRAEHGEAGLSNAEIRQITRLDRHRVVRLMQQLQEEEPHIGLEGSGRGMPTSPEGDARPSPEGECRAEWSTVHQHGAERAERGITADVSF